MVFDPKKPSGQSLDQRIAEGGKGNKGLHAALTGGSKDHLNPKQIKEQMEQAKKGKGGNSR